MKGSMYQHSGDSVQLSFKRASHQNLAVSGVASVSTRINKKEIILSMTVGAHVKIGDSSNATTADMVLPAGVWPMLIDEGSYISVLKLTGSEDGQVSVIIPED